MPMSFSLTQMLLISAAYLAALFGVAWISERGMIPRAIIRHPLTYTLSLGVSISASGRCCLRQAAGTAVAPGD